MPNVNTEPKTEVPATQFITHSGVTLTLQPVKALVLQNFMLRVGLFAQRDLTAEQLRAQLTHDGNANERGRASIEMFNYCMAFGVVETPDAAALTVLQQLGAATAPLEVARANWLRYLVLADAQEAGALAGKVMYLTLLQTKAE